MAIVFYFVIKVVDDFMGEKVRQKFELLFGRKSFKSKMDENLFFLDNIEKKKYFK